jgi:hypothetical protein
MAPSTAVACIVETPSASTFTSPAIVSIIDPEIAFINVVVLTATSLAFTVICVPAPTAAVLAVEPLYAADDTKPFPIVKSSRLVPNALLLIVLLAKDVFGIAFKPNVNVSDPASAEIVSP